MLTLVPTIDVEAIRSLSIAGDFDKLILGEIKGKYYGVPKIIEILENYHGNATFFIDYAEHTHGVEKLTGVSQYIKDHNFDVQLHIHPQFISGKNSYLMHEYSLEEQQLIFNQALQIYENCNGRKPLAFRAGGYGADEKTLQVLFENGIICDSSYFPGHKACKLAKRPLNVVSFQEGLYNFPITVFNNEIHYTLFRFEVTQRTLLKKTDLNSCSLAELKLVFNRMAEKKDQVMDLFMHSYSLIMWNSRYQNYKPNYAEIDKLNEFLDFAKDAGARIISLEQLLANIDEWTGKESFVPEIKTRRKLSLVMLQALRNQFRRVIRGR